MKEKPSKMTDEQLSLEITKGRLNKSAGTLLKGLGIVIFIIGVIMGGNFPVIILGGIVLALGEWIYKKAHQNANQTVYTSIVPEILRTSFENIQTEPKEQMIHVKESNIPLPTSSDISGNGYIRFTYQGLDAELCNIVLTDVDEFLNENTNMWEKNEREVYSGQWMVCNLGRHFPSGLTFWPRGKLDKLFHSRTIKTEYEIFNKRFNLSCDNENWALDFLSTNRMERILKLTETAFSDFSVSLHDNGMLYIAVHSGHGFFDIGKGRENPEALRQRYTDELKWFTDMIDAFRLI